MLWKEGHVVLKPLGVVHQHLHALTGIKILDLNHCLITSRVTQRVIVNLNEAIDVIHISLGILHPIDVIELPFHQIAGLIVCNQIPQSRCLLVIFSILRCLIQPKDDLFNGL